MSAIQFERFELSNGLRVIVHEDNSTPMVALNILYDVGAKDESPNQTGFAHLFEHLMFGGSINIPDYDEPLQMAGGENNAYTTNDLTDYFIELPRENIEIAFWLESDRMLSLAFSEKSLEVQRKVVIEEFKEHYINKPYGDAWKILRSMAYQKHPYQWMTIGKEIQHIENITLEDVRNFFKKHYSPQNAILCVAGNIQTETVRQLTEKWFGNISAGNKYVRNITPEPLQTEERSITHYAEVPANAIYKAWHMSGRLNVQYYCADIICEILSNGESSRLYSELVKQQQLFSHITCFHTGSLEPGLLVIEGKLLPNININIANKAIEDELIKLTTSLVAEEELQKAKNKIEALITFEDMSLLARSNNLAFYELLGDAKMMNMELEKYLLISRDQILATAQEIFKTTSCNTLNYLSTQYETSNYNSPEFV